MIATPTAVEEWNRLTTEQKVFLLCISRHLWNGSRVAHLEIDRRKDGQTRLSHFRRDVILDCVID